MCVARRTKSGGGERDRKTASSTSTKSSSSNRSQITGTRPSKSSSSSNSRPAAGQGSKQQGISEIETFIRNTPVANRFLDGILILGDAVMLLATEMSSERLPLEQVRPPTCACCEHVFAAVATQLVMLLNTKCNVQCSWQLGICVRSLHVVQVLPDLACQHLNRLYTEDISFPYQALASTTHQQTKSRITEETSSSCCCITCWHPPLISRRRVV
jgi:hypothetical protein